MVQRINRVENRRNQGHSLVKYRSHKVIKHQDRQRSEQRGVKSQSEFALRFHAALFGTLTILVLYYLVRSVFDERVALITSILYAVYPLHHNYSQESRPYALFTLLTVCSYLLFWQLLSAGKAKTWFSYIVVTALLFYANYFGMFVVFSQFVFTCTLLVPRISESLPEIRR